ncbi:MAG: Mth938-like domain-containing protein [Rhodospirillales bacterium]|mgnify:CR=1 FL=1|jgi:uncharacterized protein|nr:Mth938-like domain-containing protein [Rhodospirillales bacterium]
MDVIPLEVPGRQVIQSYGEGRFRIAGTVHAGSVLVWPERTEAWPVGEAGAIEIGSLSAVARAEEVTEILLVGCGARFLPVPADLREALREEGMALEWMDTGAACRTFNVLLGEDRRVAAALIAVD